MKIEKNTNYIICGDNLEWLTHLEDESVDLCYIDPPFFSNSNYEVIWGNGFEKRSFGDRFAGGITHYIEWMRPRIELIHKKLKKSGNIFLHCDHHANHRLRVLLDDIFGEKNFRNEIIWHYGQRMMPNVKQLNRKHDNIYWYSKTSDRFFYNELKEEYSIDEVRSWRGTKTDSKGEYYLENGGKGKPRYKRYIADIMKQGKPLDDVWKMRILGSTDKERLGYPTQKPEALIKRIIEMGSKKGDVVLDCFGGGGTTAKVSADLGRTFITGDVSPVSVKIMSERLYFDVPDIKFEIKNLPQTDAELKKMNGHLFAETVCEVMGWKVNEKKSGDGGIDGWTSDGTPIQIKNHEKSSAGRPDLQRFVGALGTKKKGIFVAWKFASEAKEYIAKIKQEQKIDIVAMECSSVFGGLLLDQAKGEEIEKLYLERRPKNWLKNMAKADAHQKVLEKIAKAKGKPQRKKKRDAEVS